MSKKRLRKAEKKEDTSRKARVRAAGGNSAPADALRPLRTFGDARLHSREHSLPRGALSARGASRTAALDGRGWLTRRTSKRRPRRPCWSRRRCCRRNGRRREGLGRRVPHHEQTRTGLGDEARDTKTSMPKISYPRGKLEHQWHGERHPSRSRPRYSSDLVAAAVSASACLVTGCSSAGKSLIWIGIPRTTGLRIWPSFALTITTNTIRVVAKGRASPSMRPSTIGGSCTSLSRRTPFSFCSRRSSVVQSGQGSC